MKKVLCLFALMAFALFTPTFAFDGDMDVYHEFKEDLALARDTYLSSLNMALDEKELSDPSWEAIEFEAPELKYCTLKELPAGFIIKGSHGAYKVDAEVKFVPGKEDMRYQVKYLKGTNAPGKDIMGEVFK